MKTTARSRWRLASLAIHGKKGNVARWHALEADPQIHSAEKDENAKFAEEEEQLRKNFTEKVKSEETRFRQWEQQVSTTAAEYIRR